MAWWGYKVLLFLEILIAERTLPGNTMKILTDGSDLEGVEKTEDILYIKILRQSMRILDAWPKGPNESCKQRYFLNCINVVFVPCYSMYIWNNIGRLTFFELGHNYITVLMCFIALSRSLMVISDKYNKIVFYYLNEIHLFNHRQKSDYAYKTHILVHKISHFYTLYLLSVMVIGILFFNLVPLYNSYTNGMFRAERPPNATFEHSLYFVVPFDCTTNLKGYIVVHIFNWYISCTCSTYFCCIDLTISLMVFDVWGHMRILSYNLVNFPKPASLLTELREDNNEETEHKYTEQESKEVLNRLREYINYHNTIIDFSSRMSNSFGEVILVYFLFHQIVGCLLLLVCSQMDMEALVRYGPLTLICFQQMIQLSIIFELLGSSNDKLVDSVYAVPWEYMDTEKRKLVFVMLIQSQRSTNLKAMNVLPVGVRTMTAILKTSFSYFIMLKAFAD